MFYMPLVRIFYVSLPEHRHLPRTHLPFVMPNFGLKEEWRKNHLNSGEKFQVLILKLTQSNNYVVLFRGTR